MSYLVFLVPLFPLLGFLHQRACCVNNYHKPVIGFIESGAVLASFVVSVMLFLDVKAGTTGKRYNRFI